MEFEFEPLEALRVRPEEEVDQEIWQPHWNCFCCRDTGKIQPDLVRHIIPSYNYDRDRIPMCQNCDRGDDWLHLDKLGVIDQRLSPQICRKLDAFAREDWRLTTQAWFEMAQKRISQGTTEIAQGYNVRRRDRIQAEFILSQERHGKARGDWEEIKDEDAFSKLRD